MAIAPVTTNELLRAPRTLEVSPEAERLLTATYDRFGVGKTVESARRSCESLEKRFQWAKAQFLGVVAVVVFMVDTILKFILK